MSRFAEIAKENYRSGQWTKTMLRRLVNLGRITEEEYEEIVGEPHEL